VTIPFSAASNTMISIVFQLSAIDSFMAFNVARHNNISAVIKVPPVL